MYNKSFIIAIVIALVPGCATVLKGKQSSIAVSSATAGADVVVDGQKAGVTPMEVTLATNAEHVIAVRAAGKEESCRVTTSASTGWIVLDIALTGGIGLIVDYATHSWNNLDKATCAVAL